jgi:hypothetical protein
MNNEPVAWMDYLEHSDVYDLNVSGRGIPLYTHTAKTLTEEQVIDITKAFFNIHPETHLTEKFNIPLYELTHFARAILKKAQEK